MGEQPFDEDEKEIKDSLESDQFREKLFLIAGISMMIFIALIIAFGLTSCTITQTLVHTEGTASDVVDETETTSPDVKPTTDLTIPLKAI